VAHTPAFDAYPVGQTALRPASPDGGPAEVIAPDGASRTVRAEASGEGDVYRIPLETPGIWRVRAGGREADRFACAVDALKGADLTAAGVDRLGRVFGRARLRVVGAGESLTDAVTEARHGRELWRLFLGLGLALMAVEMVLGRASASRGESQAGEAAKRA
jgi:hypothetical protein